MVCEEWRTFSNFIEDMGRRPSDHHSIDRIDNDGNYCPENCRWATRKEQAENSSRAVMLTFDNRTMCIRDWGIELGISRSTIQWRIKNGWSIDRALSEPVIRGRNQFSHR